MPKDPHDRPKPGKRSQPTDPTTDPNQPTADPTTDPNQPTADPTTDPNQPTDPAKTEGTPGDLDADGYSAAEDPDDSDPNIVPGPALQSFTLNPDTVRSGDPVITGGITGEIGLDGPAPAGGVQVDISGGDDQGAVGVAEGQTMGRFTLDVTLPHLFPVGTYFGRTGDAADMVLEARLGGLTKTAVLHMVNE